MMDTTTVAGLERVRCAVREIREVVPGLLQDPASDLGLLVELAREMDGVERTDHGLLLRTLARVDQIKVVPGGVGPWLTAELGYQPGRGRAVARDARRIGAMPTLADALSSGRLGQDRARVLSRAVGAVRTTTLDPEQTAADTLDLLDRHGVQNAEAHVRVLEHTMDPGRAEDLQARQRARSFGRVSELPEGMCRFDLLLDAERATLVRTALDIQVSAFLRARQYDGAEQVPEDVVTTGQLTAEAFTRLAEVFLTSTEERRAERYAPTVVYYAPDPTAQSAPAFALASGPVAGLLQETAADPGSPTVLPAPPGRAQTLYGAITPAPLPTSLQHPAPIRLTQVRTRQPAEHDTTARPAPRAQRPTPAVRDHVPA